MAQTQSTSKDEMREFAEALVILRKLPAAERIAFTYYMKGRLDAVTDNFEFPLWLAERDLVGSGAL